MDSYQLKNKLANIFAVIAAASLLTVLVVVVALKIHVNSDAIAPYSFARDIIEHIPIWHWQFPAPPFTFPDYAVSLFIVFFLKQPWQWFLGSALAQPLTLILFLTFRKDKTGLTKPIKFVGICYLFILIFVLGSIFFNHAWIESPARIVVLVHHMYAAIMAILLFLWTTPENNLKLNSKLFIFYSALCFILAFSDLFFMVYFFALAFARICVYQTTILRNLSWLVEMIILFLIALLGIYLNYRINPGFSVQLHQTTPLTTFAERLSGFVHITHLRGVILFFILPIVLLSLYIKKTQPSVEKNTIAALSLGCIFIGIIVVGAGLITAIYTLRYLGIYFPAMIFIASQLTTNKLYQIAVQPIISFGVILIAFIIGIFTLHNIPERFLAPEFSTLYSCPDFQQQSRGGIVVATYWPAKVLFEQNNRQFRLLQTDPTLEFIYHWIYNPEWYNPQYMQSSQQSSKVFFVRYQMDPNKLQKLSLLPDAQSICNNEMIMLPLSPKLTQLAPVLKETS